MKSPRIFSKIVCNNLSIYAALLSGLRILGKKMLRLYDPLALQQEMGRLYI